MTQDLYYLAIPYHGTETEKAFRRDLSLQATTEFLKQNIYVFSPVIYVNPIAEDMAFKDPAERWEVVMPYLLSFLKMSKGLILITAPGWEESVGVRQELAFCTEHRIPVFKISPRELDSDLSSFLNHPLSWDQVDEYIRAA